MTRRRLCRRSGDGLPLLLPLLLAGCGGAATNGAPAGPAGAAVQQQGRRLPAPMVHDFGTIPHGRTAAHDFVLDTRAVDPGLVAQTVHVDCSCAHAELFLRDRDGKERKHTHRFLPENVPRDGEVLVVRMTLDAGMKEAADVPAATSIANVVLQPIDAPDPASARVFWPLHLKFAIDSPVKLQPFATLDFERVPESTQPELLTTLRSDLPGRAVAFGPVTCDDPRITAKLEPDGERTLLRVRFTPPPQKLGPFQAVLGVGTDLPEGYRFAIVASGTVVPDIEVSPMPKLSFRADTRRAQTETEASSQYLIVRDHDRRRDPEFAVHRVVDAAGQDAAASFAISFTTLQGAPRDRRMSVRYLGGQPGDFRGRIELTKDGPRGPFVVIELVVFAQKQP